MKIFKYFRPGREFRGEFRGGFCPAVAQVCRKNVPGLPKPGGLATGIGHIGPRLEQVTSIPADRRQNSRKPATKSTQTGDGKDRQGRSGVVSPPCACGITRTTKNISEKMHVSGEESGKKSILLWSTFLTPIVC
jgi:hypothetical protein